MVRLPVAPRALLVGALILYVAAIVGIALLFTYFLRGLPRLQNDPVHHISWWSSRHYRSSSSVKMRIY